jgi:hypothetical protein
MSGFGRILNKLVSRILIRDSDLQIPGFGSVRNIFTDTELCFLWRLTIALFSAFLCKEVTFFRADFVPRYLYYIRRRSETAGCPYDKKNPYVAFRRRTEKMQTRKNRKSDEGGYLVCFLRSLCILFFFIKKRAGGGRGRRKSSLFSLFMELSSLSSWIVAQVGIRTHECLRPHPNLSMLCHGFFARMGVFPHGSWCVMGAFCKPVKYNNVWCSVIDSDPDPTFHSAGWLVDCLPIPPLLYLLKVDWLIALSYTSITLLNVCSQYWGSMTFWCGFGSADR